MTARFPTTSCSQCGGTFGPGEAGFSHCDDHETVPPTVDRARADLVAYAKALVTGNTEAAIRIEKRYDLFGYPPQIVSIALHAAAEGRDHMEAVDEYLEDEES